MKEYLLLQSDDGKEVKIPLSKLFYRHYNHRFYNYYYQPVYVEEMLQRLSALSMKEIKDLIDIVPLYDMRLETVDKSILKKLYNNADNDKVKKAVCEALNNMRSIPKDFFEKGSDVLFAIMHLREKYRNLIKILTDEQIVQYATVLLTNAYSVDLEVIKEAVERAQKRLQKKKKKILNKVKR